MNNQYNNYPDEIAKMLGEIANISEEKIKDLEEAIFCIKVTAENEYNHDCWRTLYKVLDAICDNYTQSCESLQGIIEEGKYKRSNDKLLSNYRLAYMRQLWEGVLD